jgi:Family of unknown function (DUF6221)
MSTNDPAAQPSIRADLDALVTFLLARLDEDEVAARTHLHGREFLPFESIVQTADHGARHGPLRVLREVTAMRAVVQMWRDSSRAQGDRLGAGRTELAEAMIVAMATVFAQHPDFDPEWLGTLEEPGEEPDNVVPLPGI